MRWFLVWLALVGLVMGGVAGTVVWNESGEESVIRQLKVKTVDIRPE